MIYFSNTANSIHQPRKSNLFILPLLLLLICSCKKEEISPSGKQITETRNPGTFNSISTNSAVNIHISQGDTHSVTIKGSDNLIQHFNTNIVNDELILSYKQGNIRSNDLEIWLTLPSLEKLSTSGSGNIEILGNFNDQESFTIRNTGSANIHLIGSIRSNRFKFYNSGTGFTDLSAMWTNIAEFELPGNGNIKINVQEELKAKINGSGNIYYSGNPTLISDIKGNGKLIKINMPND